MILSKETYLLLGYNADIICLQEVDRKHFNHDFQPLLSYIGYESNYCPKGGAVAEGLAFIYYKNKFNLLESNRMVLSENLDKNPIFADIWQKVATNTNLSSRILDRTTVLQTNVLESLTCGSEIVVVANTHLYFHPDADHIRLIQAGVIIRYLEKFVENLKDKVYCS